MKMKYYTQLSLVPVFLSSPLLAFELDSPASPSDNRLWFSLASFLNLGTGKTISKEEKTS